MQDNKANSIANVPTGLLSTTPNQQQATHLTATTQEQRAAEARKSMDSLGRLMTDLIA